MRVGVVGAGTAGPACALFLNEQGHEVVLFERAPAPSPVGAGITLQPTGLSILRQLGLEERVVSAGSQIERLYGRTRQGKTVLDLKYASLAPGLFGVGVHRGALFSALMQRVRETTVQVRTGAHVLSLKDGTTKARLFTEAHGMEDFDLVIVADGARSQLRDHAIEVIRAKPYEWGALWAVVECDDPIFHGGSFAHSALDSTLTQVFEGTRRFVGFLPSGRNPESGRALTSIFWSIPCAEMDTFRLRGIEYFKEQVRELTTDVEPLLAQLDDAAQLLPAHYFDVVTRPATSKRIVVTGDAAHAMSPQLGQGANLALYDAWVLSLALERCAVPEALVRYSQERERHVWFYQFATRMLTPFFQSEWDILGTLRDAAMGPLCRLPFFGRQGLAAMAGYKSGIFSEVAVSRRFRDMPR